jgi:hypothetical protein
MRQVSRQDYEILTKYHPGEIRYYVDLQLATRKTTGTKVTVKPKRKKTNGDARRRPKNSPVRLIKSNHEFTHGTLQHTLYFELNRVFKRDPTMCMGRTDLVKLLMKRSGKAENQVGPFVSDCMFKHGILKYQGE